MQQPFSTRVAPAVLHKHLGVRPWHRAAGSAHRLDLLCRRRAEQVEDHVELMGALRFQRCHVAHDATP
jgi:hypothetical protein|eukprot:COSAG06_NODE_312_length_17767_cov_17.644895_17_plen_68_part_00